MRLLQQFQQGQTLRKARGVQGVESQSFAGVQSARASRGSQPALAMGLELGCNSVNLTRLVQATVEKGTLEGALEDAM